MVVGHTVRLRGAGGTIVWAYHTAATLRTWTIARAPGAAGKPGPWVLSATLERAEGFYLRQRPLRFTAPRKGGFWCWPIKGLTVGTTTLVAELGPVEY